VNDSVIIFNKTLEPGSDIVPGARAGRIPREAAGRLADPQFCGADSAIRPDPTFRHGPARARLLALWGDFQLVYAVADGLNRSDPTAATWLDRVFHFEKASKVDSGPIPAPVPAPTITPRGGMR
jgi:hypothetical protein